MSPTYADITKKNIVYNETMFQTHACGVEKNIMHNKEFGKSTLKTKNSKIKRMIGEMPMNWDMILIDDATTGCFLKIVVANSDDECNKIDHRSAAKFVDETKDFPIIFFNLHGKFLSGNLKMYKKMIHTIDLACKYKYSKIFVTTNDSDIPYCALCCDHF